MLADLLLRPRFPSTGVSACPAGGTSCAAADEVRTTISYGANLQPSSVASGSGDGALAATTAMTYDLAGNLVTVDGPLPGTADTVRYFYNAARERVGTISPDPDGTGPLPNRAQRLTFNPVGQVTKVEVGTTAGQSDAAWAAMVVHEAAEIFYDDDSRKVKETLVAGATTHAVVQYSYDALGRLDCTAQRMNPDAFGSLPNSACNHGTMGDFGRDRLSRTFYDAASRVLKVQSGIGTDWARDDVTNTYTPNGRLATVTDAEANRTTWEYDLFDRLEKTRYPSKTIPNQSSTLDFELFAYDAGSRVTSRTLRDGTVIAFGYDDLDRLVLKDLPGAETSTTYVYDWLNRLTSAAQVNVDATFVHDALSRVTGSTAFLASGINLTTAYQYDLAGRRTRITHDDGFIVTYNHLVTGETISVREGVFGDPASVMLATYDYDDRRRRIAINRTNSTTTTYSYDPISRLTALTQNLLGGNDDLALGFSNYNPAGQIGRTTRDNDSYSFDDHAAGTIPSIPNGLNQLTQVDAETLQYDPRGNVTSDPSSGSGQARTYTYSSENLLTSATVGGQQVTLQYDPLMRLRTTSGTAVRRFVYDGVDLISEHNGPGTLVRRYVHGPGLDEPLVEYTGTDNTTRRWLHADERGSIVAVSDATGAAVVKNSYDEYGNPGAGNDGRFQYTGQTWIPELKLYYYKARFYDPRLGRFMQPDPIGYGAGMNLYAYVGADPVNFVDPLGLQEAPYEEDTADDPIIVIAPCRGLCGFEIGDTIGHSGMIDLGAGRWNNEPAQQDSPQRSEPNKPPEMSRSACTALVGGVLIAGTIELGTTALHVARSGYGLHAILAGATSVVTLKLVGIAVVSGAAVYVADRVTDGAISNFAGKQLGICK